MFTGLVGWLVHHHIIIVHHHHQFTIINYSKLRNVEKKKPERIKPIDTIKITNPLVLTFLILKNLFENLYHATWKVGGG